MKKTARLITLLLVFALALTACGGGTTESSSSAAASTGSTASSSADSGAADSGESSTASASVAAKADPTTIIYGMDGEPGNMDPQNNPQLAGMCAEKQVYEPLINKNPETGEFEPCLATAWEWTDDTHLKFTLREGVKFHNGQDFTSADVVKTVERMRVGSASASLYSAFLEAVPNGDYEVTIEFEYPFGPALNFLTNGRAYIVPHEYLEENGEQSLYQNMIGTGPYKFGEWVIGSYVSFTRNDEYWGEKAHVENAMIRFIIDNTARMVALETGEIDFANGIQDSDMQILMNGEHEHIKGEPVPGMQVNYLAFNLNVEPLQDVRVRQAIAHAVDWEATIETAAGMTFALADSCVAPTIDYYKSIGTYEYDPELSKQLLEEAGYADGFTIQAINEEVPAAIRVLEIMQQYLAEVGITMEIQSVDNATWIESNTNGTSDVSIVNMTASTGDPVHTLNQTTGSMVTGRIDNEEYLELFDAGMRASADEREQIYADIQQLVFDEVLQLPLYVRVITYGYWDYLDGLYLAPDNLVSFAPISIIEA